MRSLGGRCYLLHIRGGRSSSEVKVRTRHAKRLKVLSAERQGAAVRTVAWLRDRLLQQGRLAGTERSRHANARDAFHAGQLLPP
eukprot:6584887-Prymnesium_polylepis.1